MAGSEKNGPPTGKKNGFSPEGPTGKCRFCFNCGLNGCYKGWSHRQQRRLLLLLLRACVRASVLFCSANANQAFRGPGPGEAAREGFPREILNHSSGIRTDLPRIASGSGGIARGAGIRKISALPNRLRNEGSE